MEHLKPRACSVFVVVSRCFPRGPRPLTDPCLQKCRSKDVDDQGEKLPHAFENSYMLAWLFIGHLGWLTNVNLK